MSWLQAALQLLFPLRCPGCGAEVGAKGAWCAKCLNELWNPRRLDVVKRGMTHLAACQVLTGYEGAIRTLLHGLKFQRRRGNAAPLAWLVSMADEAELAELPLGKGIVVPVPVSTMRREERGYNQVDLIFGDWCRRQGMKWESDILVRQRSTLPQWELDRQGRNDNIKGAFVVNAPAKINRHPIILVDDIVTTGRTLEECALVLRKAGAASVHALALANGSANLRH